MQDTWNGHYKYKGWIIWSSGEKVWRCDPNWSIKAIENFKGSNECEDFPTIAKAKQWIREVGVTLEEKDYLG